MKKSLLKKIFGVMLAGTMMFTLVSCKSSESEKVINLLSWSGLEDSELKKLEEMTGYKINYTEFSSLEEMQSKVMSNSTQYDVAMCSDYTIEALVAQNKLEEIETSKIENYSKIGEGYLSPSFDKENKWSVPYTAGGIGILVNRDKVTVPITSYADLWKSELKKQIVMTDDQRMALSICNLVNGNEFCSKDENEIKDAGSKLEELLPNICAFQHDGYKLMLNGEANVLVEPSVHAFRAAREMDNWEYINPSEGEHMFIDSFVIPKGANKEAANKFINAAISIEFMELFGEDTIWGNGYTNKDVRVDAEKSGISKELLKIAYPDDNVFKTAHFMEDVGESSIIYDDVWSEMKLKAESKLES